ncbi:hypothetical protein GGI24_004851, partial [Coemansia furcata]
MDYLVLLETWDDIGEGTAAIRQWELSGTDFLKAQGFNIPEQYQSIYVEDAETKRLLFGIGVGYNEEDIGYANGNTELVVILMTDGKWRLVKDKKFIED